MHPRRRHRRPSHSWQRYCTVGPRPLSYRTISICVYSTVHAILTYHCCNLYTMYAIVIIRCEYHANIMLTSYWHHTDIILLKHTEYHADITIVTGSQGDRQGNRLAAAKTRRATESRNFPQISLTQFHDLEFTVKQFLSRVGGSVDRCDVCYGALCIQW